MITSFKGEYSFLSNFHPAQVEFDGEIYPSTEHAYQAAKTMDRSWRTTIRLAETAVKAKRLGKKVPMRDDWHRVKVGIMQELVRKKFTRNRQLGLMLLSTGNQELIEGNYWNDTFWGVCNGKGLNTLGKILMSVRQELANDHQD